MTSRYLIGTSGWAYDDWRGLFYPANLAKTKWLEYYASQFSTVEINATFYREFSKKTYEKWFAKVPDDFRYVVKVPRMITHYKKLKNCETLIEIFESTSAYLKYKRALILLQLPPNLAYDLKLLENALLAFQHRSDLVVEFRNKIWHTNDVKNLLTKLHCIYCCTDSPIMQLQGWVTSDIAYLRLHGRDKWFDYNYSNDEILAIVRFVKQLERQGAKQIHIYFNNDYHINAINNARELSRLLGNY